MSPELTTLFQLLHSWTRWLVIIVIVVAAVYFLLGIVQNKAWDKRGQTLLSIFSGLIGLQWILGLVLFFIYQTPAGFTIRHQWEHLVTMTIVLIVAHIHHAWRRRQMPDARRWRYSLVLVLGVTVLVIAGISVLPGVIQWRFFIPG